MQRFIRSAAFIVSMAAASLAHAEHFNFSYTFSNGGPFIEGRFQGTANGNLVTDIKDVFVSVDGVRVRHTGSLQAWSYDYVTQTWTDSAVASFDGYANNFIFANDTPASGNFYDTFLMVPVGADTQVQIVPYGYYLDRSNDGSIQARWNLTLAPVPEPETYGMLIAGLGLLGVAARRRNRPAQ